MGKVTFVDETTSGDRRAVLGLDVAEERLALRELIRRRVYEEAGDGQEAGRAYEHALAAFGRNGFLVLVGDRQIAELDQEVELADAAEVAFLRLVPLAGG
ncbi:hypothetical protein AB0M39_24090 [Streptomyces sp. NPDC051907]|uniref:hypothetical protein n=1 Tax=Streptomyces sp. NPDC051907 TaxID=3155284 RepID=UPI0034369A09